MDPDGGDQRQLADAGGCADLRFSPSGRTVSFTSNTATAPATHLSVWTASIVVGEPQAVTTTDDEWNRSNAQWLPDSRLIYSTNDAGSSVLFVQDDDGSEREVSAHLLTGSHYAGIGDVVVGDTLLAVEALGKDRRSRPGVVALRRDGSRR